MIYVDNVATTQMSKFTISAMLNCMEETWGNPSGLRDRPIAGLSQIPHTALNGDHVNRLPGNVNFCFEGIEGESLLLDDRGICASSGSACTSSSLDPSHVSAGHRLFPRGGPRFSAAVSM